MNDNLQDELGRSLRHQADGISGAPISFDAVRGTAGRIRRNRRRAAAAGAVLAVGAAIVAPTAIMGGFGEDRSTPPVVTPPVDPGSASYLDVADSTAHGADGGELTLDTIGDSGTIGMPDGRLVTLQRDQDSGKQPPVHTVTVLGADGKRVSDHDAASDALAWTPSGDAVTWVAPDGTPMVLRSGEPEPMRLARIPAAAAEWERTVRPLRLGGFDESSDCLPDGDGLLDGCKVIVQVSDMAGNEAWESSNVNDAPDRFATDVLAVAPDGDLFVRRTEDREGQVCAGTFRRSGIGGEATPEPFGEVCHNENLGFHFTFSPDGQLVASQPGEGAGPLETQVLDAETLEQVTTVRTEGGAYVDQSWQDEVTLQLLVNRDPGGSEEDFEIHWLRLGDEVASGTARTGNVRLLAPGTWSPVSDEPTAPTEPGTAQPGDLTIRDLSTGEAPKIAWLEGEVLHLPDGRDVRLERAYDQVADLGGRWLAYDRAEGEVSELDTMQFEAVRSWPATGEFVVGEHGAAWLSEGGVVTVLPSTAPDVVELGAFDAGAELVAITGDCRTTAETTVGGGCRVFVNTEDADGSAFLSMDNHSMDASPASSAITDGKDVFVMEDGRLLMSGVTEVKEDTSTCSAVTRPDASGEGDRAAWTTCLLRPVSFSPDGQTLLALDTIGSGLGEGLLAFVDADDGAVLLERSNRDSHAFFTHAVWEDESHVLATVFQEGEWAVVRVGTDGSMELASDVRDGEESEPPFVLSTQP